VAAATHFSLQSGLFVWLVKSDTDDQSRFRFTRRMRCSRDGRIEITTKASGADQFIDLATWRNELGDAEAFEKVAAAIQHHILS
jgi:hypothetical protein